jgi:two-component system response regulator AtoC
MTPAAVAPALVRRVLVVDDEPLIRWSLHETLGERGYAVFEAEDGRGALEEVTAGNQPPELIVLDYRLPDSNDLGLLSRIVSMAPSSRVILMTAHYSPELARAALDRGAFSVLHKPFELEQLTSLLC